MPQVWDYNIYFEDSSRDERSTTIRARLTTGEAEELSDMLEKLVDADLVSEYNVDFAPTESWDFAEAKDAILFELGPTARGIIEEDEEEEIHESE